jgi:UDP-2,4-diacetamido-2,4,6-trideoxy-beta-L-altropyranose hydrolase
MSIPTILIRADASRQIGTGHIMRCLTIATTLRAKGLISVFVCRPFDGHLMGLLEEKGFAIACLSTPNFKDVNPNTYDTWLGACSESDAAETLSILTVRQLDWVIVDHYGIDEKWEKVVREKCKKLFVIDDLANRHHSCDMLVDSSYGRNRDDYSALVPADSLIYTGTSFCMLRPEFRLFREEMNLRDYQRPIKHILVTLGGADANNLTSQVLQELEDAELSENVSIVILIGRISEHYEAIKQQALQSRHSVTVRQDILNMAECLVWADLCIGAVGSSVWERCCLGCPSIVGILAENQREGAQKLEKVGVSLSFSTSVRGQLAERIKDMDSQMRERQSVNGMKIVDGLGVQRVINLLLEHS